MVLQPVVKKNIFTPEERKLLLDAIDEQFSSKPRVVCSIENVVKNGWEGNIQIEVDKGKATMHIDPLPEKVADRLVKHAADIGFNITRDRLIPVFMRYSSEYGIPYLEPHLDLVNLGMSLDYSIRANIKWPVIIDSVEYPHDEDNEGIFWEASAIPHWRNKKTLNDGDFVEVMICHFNIGPTVNYTREEKQEIFAPHLAAWNLQHPTWLHGNYS